MRIIPGNAQHVGNRSEQQDAFGFTDIDDTDLVVHGGVLAVMADGMGGMALGQQASHCAVQTLLTVYAAKTPDASIPATLLTAVHQANTEVLQLAEEADLSGRVGTTLVAAVIHHDVLHWLSVGDSRLYVYREATLSQMTTDHVYAWELAQAVEKGILSQEEAEQHPERSSLTSYVGIQALQEMDTSETPLPLHIGDRVVLCSDGLYGCLEETEIASELAADPQRAAERLVEKALAKGKTHQDNITAIIMACEAEREDQNRQDQQDQLIQPQFAPVSHQSKRQKARSASPVVLGLAFLLVWAIGVVMGWCGAEFFRAKDGYTAQQGETQR